MTADGTPPLRLQVMGPLRVRRAGVELDAGPRQQRCLLALLLVRVGRPVSMTDLVASIWVGDPPPSAVNVIHKYVSALRRLLEPGLPRRSAGSHLLRDGAGYRFAAGPEVLDLVEFRHLVTAGAGAARPEEALDHYTAALRLCRGHTAYALADTAAATAAFAGVDDEFFAAAVSAAGLADRAGRPEVVLAPLRRAAEMGRLHEPVHAGLVTALAAAGHRAEALAGYRAIRDRLAEDLGIDPGRELREAHRGVLARVDPGSRPIPLVHPAQLPPDQRFFSGRRHELGVLRDLVAGIGGSGSTGPTTIALHGVGGVGKSTVATHFAHLVSGAFPDGQLYLDLQEDGPEHGGGPGSGRTGVALRSLLLGLGVRAPDVPDTFDALAGTYRSLTRGMRLLVVLDDARGSAQLRSLLPSSSRSLVLITSRSPLVGLAASDGARLLRIDPPGPAEARALLRARSGATASRVVADAAVLDEIIELCGRLPQALAVLAARLDAEPQLSPGAIVAELRDGARRMGTAVQWKSRGPVSGSVRRSTSTIPTDSTGSSLP